MDIEIGATSSGNAVLLPLRFANRHGLVTGATGTGKTVTLQRMAEQFSAAGVPVFASDVKGDLSGIGTNCPTEFWDVFGRKGHPIRTSVQEIGAQLMARMLNLNEVQAGALAVLFQRAEDDRNYLLDLEDLRWALVDLAEEREEVSQKYGHVTSASINTIQRQLLALEAQGGGNLFGEPTLDISDFMRTLEAGAGTLGATSKGIVNLLHADKLMEAPKLYATLLLWLLTELFRKLPEVGDLDKPKLVFFFDEAHLLFSDAPKALLEHIERVVRLVRSKGVGVYFVTQSPADVPDAVMAQLGNRVQHALRAYTARDQRMVKAAVRAFRPNKGVDVQKAVTEMAVGEALVSFLVDDGVPAPVERIRVSKPKGKIGQISDIERETAISNSGIRDRYPKVLDSHESHEQFRVRMLTIRGIKPGPARPAAKDVDWVKVMAPLNALGRQARPGMRLPTKLLLASFAVLALYGVAGWLMPG